MTQQKEALAEMSGERSGKWNGIRENIVFIFRGKNRKNIMQIVRYCRKKICVSLCMIYKRLLSTAGRKNIKSIIVYCLEN